MKARLTAVNHDSSTRGRSRGGMREIQYNTNCKHFYSFSSSVSPTRQHEGSEPGRHARDSIQQREGGGRAGGEPARLAGPPPPVGLGAAARPSLLQTLIPLLPPRLPPPPRPPSLHLPRSRPRPHTRTHTHTHTHTHNTHTHIADSRAYPWAILTRSLTWM